MHDAFIDPGRSSPARNAGDTLFAPEWSEYFDDRRIRHLWSCDGCGYEFETEVCYPAPAAAASNTKRV